MGQDRECCALAVLFLEAGQTRLACRVVAEEQDRRFREGPRERRMADLCAGGALALPGRFLGALDQAAIGHNILDPWEAGEVMPLIQEPETEDLANARDRLEQVQRVGIMLLGHGDNGQLQVPQQLVIIVDQGEVHRDAFLDRGSGKALGDPGAVGLVRDLCADVGQVILAIGLLDMCQQLSPLAHEMYAASEQVSRGAHGRGIDVGVGQHATT